MNTRLAIDLGTNSIGWWLYCLNNSMDVCGVIDGGVRIFSDGRNPKDNSSLAKERREKRSMRRNRDRYLLRRECLMDRLVKYGLMPVDTTERKQLERLDPYSLRKQAIDNQIDIFHLGRVFFHLNQRRGFKSNRKTNKKDTDSGILKSSINQFKMAIKENNCRTAGEYLYMLHSENQSVRARLKGAGKNALYDIYTDREMTEDEFIKLWKAQVEFYPDILTKEAYDNIHNAIFYQRPLKPVQVGRCSCEPSQLRAPKALIISQKFKILQTVTDLRITFSDLSTRRLTYEEQLKLYNRLQASPKVNFDQIRLLLGFDSDVSFSHEHLKHIKGEDTARLLKKHLGKQWEQLLPEMQNDIVQLLLNEEDDEKIVTYFESNFGISKENAENIMNLSFEEGYMSFCEEVITKLVALMEQGFDLSESLEKCGYGNRSPHLMGELDKLPYYGKILEKFIGTGSNNPQDPDEICFGKISNPTVHRGLKQLERVVNRIIETYGKPSQIVLELGRELKQSQRQKKEIITVQKENERRNEHYKEILDDLKLPNNRDNRDRLKLWEELGTSPLSRFCIYSGKPISRHQLFSNEIEIEHILPFSKTFDNSMANKTVSFRVANRYKTNQSPYEAFANSAVFIWDDIVARSLNLPQNKRWRFSKDAMERYQNENNFIDRQLQDTQYFSRIARIYLTAICRDTWSVNGKMTALMRRWTGLNGILSDSGVKNRNDHRHHAIDAAAIGLIDRANLMNISRLSGQGMLDNLYTVNETLSPWESFFSDVKGVCDNIIVSHKQEHGKAASLHEETAYGIVSIENNAERLVTRKPVTSLSKNEIENIRDKKIQAELVNIASSYNEKTLAPALAEYSELSGIKRVRYLKKQDNYIKIKDKDGKPYKAYISGDYHHIDVYETDKGKIHFEPTTFFQINSKDYVPAWKKIKPKTKLLLRLHKKDIIQATIEGVTEHYVILKLEPSNSRAIISKTTVAGKMKDIEKNKDLRIYFTFNKTNKWQVKKIKVDEIGQIKELRF